MFYGRNPSGIRDVKVIHGASNQGVDWSPVKELISGEAGSLFQDVCERLVLLSSIRGSDSRLKARKRYRRRRAPLHKSYYWHWIYPCFLVLLNCVQGGGDRVEHLSKIFKFLLDRTGIEAFAAYAAGDRAGKAEDNLRRFLSRAKQKLRELNVAFIWAELSDPHEITLFRGWGSNEPRRRDISRPLQAALLAHGAKQVVASPRKILTVSLDQQWPAHGERGRGRPNSAKTKGDLDTGAYIGAPSTRQIQEWIKENLDPVT